MSQLYPLLLTPQFHPRVWGARDLAPIYGAVEGEPIGEVWLTGDGCRVANGPLAGRTLADVTREFGAELTGDAAPDATRFPLLVKFLFPREKLSVQVHPDDEQARRAGQPCGKTECWYVLAADPGAQVALGLKSGVTRRELETAIRETRAEELLNWVNIAPGEMIYVEAGTVHTIGPGSVLVETQQNSDTTYRLYDYGRPRELHVREGLAAVKERTGAGKVEPASDNDRTVLVQSPCFVVDRFSLRGPLEFPSAAEAGRASVQVLAALEGSGVVEAKDVAPVSFSRGEVVVVPASVREFKVRAQWELQCLRARLPAQPVAPPDTKS